MGMQQLMSITESDLKEMKQFREDRFFLETHKDELREKYPNQWVAIFNKKLIGRSGDLNSLINVLKKKGIPTGKVVIEFLSTTEDIMIL